MIAKFALNFYPELGYDSNIGADSIWQYCDMLQGRDRHDCSARDWCRVLVVCQACVHFDFPNPLRYPALPFKHVECSAPLTPVVVLQSMYDAPQRTGRIDIGRGVNLTPTLGGTFQSPASMNHDSGRMGSGLVNSALHSSGHGSNHGSGHMGSGVLPGQDTGQMPYRCGDA